MMEANELRIGNWYEITYGPMFEQVITIEAQLTAEDFMSSTIADRCKPIILTEEWLVRAGFELEEWEDKSPYSAKTEKVTGYVKDMIWCFLPRNDDKLAHFGRRIGGYTTNVWRFSEREGLHSIGKKISEGIFETVIHVHRFQDLFSALHGQLIFKEL